MTIDNVKMGEFDDFMEGDFTCKPIEIPKTLINLQIMTQHYC